MDGGSIPSDSTDSSSTVEMTSFCAVDFKRKGSVNDLCSKSIFIILNYRNSIRQMLLLYIGCAMVYGIVLVVVSTVQRALGGADERHGVGSGVRCCFRSKDPDGPYSGRCMGTR
jgi:hypothetical protein